MTPEQLTDRENAMRSYLQSFLDLYNTTFNKSLSLNIEEAAANICSLYARHLEEIVRPSVISGSGTIQHYKIIATTELAILRIAPFSTLETQNKALDAELALHVSLRMLIEWNSLDEIKCKQIFKDDKEIKSFLHEHLTWLILLDTRYLFPNFSNSQVWRLFHYLIRDRIKLL